MCREVCSEVLKSENIKVGGPGKIIVIAESKFGKRKYHKGRRKDGLWVFGGTERGTKNCFLTTVEDRSPDMLIPIIKKRVEPGTTILSDCWKAYSRLQEEGYEHQIVNQSKEFISQGRGAHMNTIESAWRAVKTPLPKHGTVKSLYDTHFVDYMFREKHLNNANDQFLKFFQCINTVYYPSNSKRLKPVHKPIKPHQDSATSVTSKQKALLPIFNKLNTSSDDDYQ